MTNEAIAYCAHCNIAFGWDDNAMIANAIHQVEWHANCYNGHHLINVTIDVYKKIYQLGLKGFWFINGSDAM